MRVIAILRDYLGTGELIETRLTGSLRETKPGVCTIHLYGKAKAGKVEIEGRIDISRFRGTATRRVGRDTFSHAISLRRQLPTEAPEVG